MTQKDFGSDGDIISLAKDPEMLNDWLNFWHKLFCFLGFGAQKAESVMDSLWVPVIYKIGNPQEAPQTGTLNSHPHYSGHPSWISQSH